MASAKQNVNKANEGDIDEVDALLQQVYKAEGVKAEDAVELIGLTPIYMPKYALAEKFPPLVGKVDRIEYLPVQREGTKDEWEPLLVRVVATQPTKAMAGVGNDRKQVEIQPGDDVLIPITGSLKVNSKLEACAGDSEKVHTIVILCTGTAPSKHPSPMYTFVVQELMPKVEARAGRFAYPLQHKNFAGALLQATATGERFNGATGELRNVPAQA